MCKILGAGGRRKGVGGIPKMGTHAGAVGGDRSLPDQRSPTVGQSAVSQSATAGRPATSGHREGDRGPQRAATSGRLPATGRRLDSW
jgi:hypothetical protein